LKKLSECEHEDVGSKEQEERPHVKIFIHTIDEMHNGEGKHEWEKI
jgi:hypothetical protein